MKFILTAVGVYIYLAISLSFVHYETDAVPMENCSAPGQQIGDTDDDTEFYVCLPNGTSYTPYPQTCPTGGYFHPDPVNPGCVERGTTTTTESGTTAAEKESTTTELPASSTDSATTEEASSTEGVVTSTTEGNPTTEGASSTEGVVTSTTEGNPTTEGASSTEGVVPSTTESDPTTEEETSSLAPTTGTPSDSETTPEEPSTTEGTPTTGPPAVYTCPSEGRFPDPVEPCSKFYQCVNISGVWYFYVYTCPSGTSYNSTLKVCATGPCTPSTTTTTTTTVSVTTTTTVAPPAPISCSTQGKFPVSGNCTSYYQCLLVNSIWYSFTYNCPPTTHYDSTKTLCLAGGCPATTTTTTVAPVNATTAVTSQTSEGESTTPSAGYVCTSQGKFQDPLDCTAYYQCILINGSYYSYKYTCPPGTYWNSTTKVCTAGTC